MLVTEGAFDGADGGIQEAADSKSPSPQEETAGPALRLGRSLRVPAEATPTVPLPVVGGALEPIQEAGEEAATSPTGS